MGNLIFMGWLALAFAAMGLLGWLLWVMAGWLLEDGPEG